MKQVPLTIIIVIGVCSVLMAQNYKRTNIWYFGRNAGIDFNTTPPTPLLDGALNIWEGCATLSDTSGNLMIYTDGIQIWNKNHQVIPGATNLGGNNSSTQSGIIVPVPNSSNMIYVFSVDSHGGSGGLRYAIVDMNMNAGLGGVVSSNNILLPTCSEKITAIQHCNKTDFWILAHNVNSNSFAVWELTSGGLSMSPTIYPVGTWHGPGSEDAIGYMKGSADGSKIALGVYGNATSFFEVFDFNNITGVISNPVFLNNPQFVHPYGVEFSPNGKLLYLAGTQNNPILFQYNLALNTPLEIQNSLTIIDYGNSSYFGAIQLGPDGIIYVAKDNGEYLSTINSPNSIGAGCNFVEDDFYLGGRRSGLGLPNLIPGYFKKAIKTDIISAVDYCQGNAALYANTNASGDSVVYNWYFNGDIVDGQETTSIQVDSSGVYTFVVQVFTNCQPLAVVDTQTLQLLIPPANIPETSLAFSICAGDSYAGYSVSGLYVDTLLASNGCDSIRTLQLTVLPVATSSQAASICAGTSYAGYSVSGMYVDTLSASNGCDSIRTLQLTVLPVATSSQVASICAGTSYAGYSVSGLYVDTLSASNGCYSIRTLQLTVLPVATSSQVASICAGTSYAGYSVSGMYVDTLSASNGCDSIRTLQLTVLPVATSSQAASICAGTSYSGYSVSGMYVDTLSASNGCDSIRTLQLTVLPVATSSQVASICAGTSYAGYSVSGMYVDTLSASNGCDSIRTLQLTVLPVATSSQVASICAGTSYAGYSVSGMYVDTLSASNGCDSIRTLQLTVLPVATSSQAASICAGTSYAGYSVSGMYVDTLSASNGCDSIRTLQLTVLPVATSSQVASICAGTSYAGYSVSGMYVDTLLASNGCDSIRTLQLTVLPVAISSQAASICAGTSYAGYSVSGMYVDTLLASNGCDSIRTLQLTVLPVATSSQAASICAGTSYAGYSVSGMYVDTLSASNGCDSIRTLQLTVLPVAISSQAASICAGTSYAGYSESGMYVDTLQSANGCDSINTLQLTVLQEATSNQIASICPGTSFNFNGQNISVSGIYVDTISTVQGCDSIISLELKIVDPEHLGDDTLVCIGDKYRLESPSVNTTWFDNAVGKFKFVEKSGTYWASFTDANGCEIVDSIVVEFNLEVFIPNVFNPNSGGGNDCFQPSFSDANLSKYKLGVYDRWGSLVFISENPFDCWDGKTRGNSCNPGVYVYVLEVETPNCKSSFLKGNVTLLR